jgi:hypothetical protein
MTIIKRARYYSRGWEHEYRQRKPLSKLFFNIRERLVMLLVHLAYLLDVLIFMVTLGFLTSELYSTLLFSDWMLEREDS